MPFDPDKALNEMKPQGGFNPDLALAEMQPQQPPAPLTAQDARTAFGQPPPPKWVDVLGRQIAETGAHILKSPYSPGTEIAGSAMAEINQLMRSQQTLGQNIAAGGINLAPYFTPIAGQALFARDIATDPSIVPELAKEVGRTYRDVVTDPKEFVGQLREAPVEKTLALAAPLLATLGIRAGGKRVAAKVKTTRAVSEQIARGRELPPELPKPQAALVEQLTQPKVEVKQPTIKKPSVTAIDDIIGKRIKSGSVTGIVKEVKNGRLIIQSDRGITVNVPYGKNINIISKPSTKKARIATAAEPSKAVREVKPSPGAPKQAHEMTKAEFGKFTNEASVGELRGEGHRIGETIHAPVEGRVLDVTVLKVDSKGRIIDAIDLDSGKYIVKNGKLQRQLYKLEKSSLPVSEIVENAHKEAVQQAINEGKIKYHPDYPELSKPPQVKAGKQAWEMTRAEFLPRKEISKIEYFPPFIYGTTKGYTINKSTLRKIKDNYEVGRASKPGDIDIAILMKDGEIVGSYKSDKLSIYEAHRKKGLSHELVRERIKIGPLSKTGNYSKSGLGAVSSFHKKEVKQALSEGKPVPESVLKDYPDLLKLQKVKPKPPDLKPPAKGTIELQAGLTPKVVGETVRKTIPDFIKQLRHRFKTESGKSLVKDVETADTKYRRRQGQQIEKFRQAGIFRGSRFRRGGLKSEAQREGLADALEGLKTDKAKLIPDEMVKAGKRIFDEMYFKAKAVGVDVTGYRKKYFPRVMKQEIGEIIFNDLKSKSQKFKELINLNQTDQVLIDLVERLADSRQFKPKTIEALKHLIKTGQAKNYGEAFRLLREQSTGDMFRPFGNLEKPRIIELPKEYYERDALKIISRYTDSWAQRLAEIEIWGKDGSKAIEKFNEIQKTNPEEAKLAETMIDIWSGEYERTRGLTGRMRKFVDFMTAFQFGTKIGLGTATVPNTTQMLISAMVAAGPYRFAKGVPAVLRAKGRSWIRSSGSTIVTAMRTMAGYEPGGLMGKVADRLSKTSGFHGINKLNQYLSAATADVFIKDLHRIYNTTKSGKRKAWAKSWLDKFNVDPSKKLTENIRQEVMYRFATDSQLQKNILNDALFFNTAYGRPLALFKRFGFRQAAWIKDVVFKQELIGNKNPLPLLRLVAGGIIGGEFVIWAKNNIRQFISGEPVYRKDDDIWERVLNDLAAVGSAGVLTDIISADNYAKSLKFAATPVYVSDAIKAYQVLEDTELDRRKYDDWAIVAKRTPSRAGQFFGSLPKYLTKRAQTTGQKKGRIKFFKGRERTEIINLILDGKGEAAGKRIALWNLNYPLSPIEIGFDDIKGKIISKMKF